MEQPNDQSREFYEKYDSEHADDLIEGSSWWQLIICVAIVSFFYACIWTRDRFKKRRKVILPMLIVMMLALGACEEIVEVEKIVVVHDTVPKPVFVDRRFIGLDSVQIPVAVSIPVVDSSSSKPVISYRDSIVYVVRLDSIYITIIEHDTVATHEIIHGDTLFVWSGGRGVYSVPNELQKYVNDFYNRATALGVLTTGPGWLMVEVQDIDDILQAYSFSFWWQWSIIVNDNLPVDQMYLPILREIARKELGKEYSADPNSLMNPFYPRAKIRWSNRAQYEQQINALLL